MNALCQRTHQQLELGRDQSSNHRFTQHISSTQKTRHLMGKQSYADRRMA